MSVNGGVHRRLQSVQRDHPRREASYSRRRTITREDAYSFALRAALLHHLLQPRSKRLQHVAAAAKPVRSSTTSATDLIKEFAPLRESKSTKLPHAFMATLDKRLEGVLMGRERMPEYKDALVKRTFAAYLNEFKRPATRKTFEESRRAETLVLVFFAQATKELQKDKSADDDSWKMMVDRHVALLCRLISAILKEQGWAKERPELAAQLATMEKKLLVHDQDLAADSTRNGGAGGYSVEVEVPVSYEVKDMPLVLIVSRVFGVPYAQVQDDINKNKSVWTEKAALQDLKLYQTSLSLNARKTLSSEDFDTEEAYETWKKAEVHDISQMIFSILQSNIELAKTNTNGAAQLTRQVTSPHDSGYSEFGRISGDNADRNSTPNFEQAIDLSGLNISGDESTPLTFLPSDPRFCYRAVLKECLVYDQMTNESQEGQSIEPQAIKLLSKDSTELLTELALRWRIPQFSRTILFMDVIKERFQNREIDLDTLDAAFNYSKEPPALDKKAKRTSIMIQPTFLEWKKWTVTDYAAYQNILNTIHDTLLRDLFDLMMGCYEAKAPSIGPVMYILNEHIYNDQLFPREPEELDEFTKRLQEELHERSAQIYRDMLNKDIPTSAKDWQFYNVIQLGKDVVKFADKIQKRYKKTPVIMGVNPLMVLVEEVFPSYAGDARELCARIMQYAEDMGQEIDIQDGFDLYGELVEIRKVHAEVLPEVPFAFEIEGLLQAFVWRWIAATETQIIGWVDEAVRQDPFTPHAQQVGEDTGGHSTSALDMFRSFKESISRIVELNWDDDLSYAKFMTALSKCVGNALARYCELMEQRFVKEMDRLTPEQEAALSRTRQEKWMQLAKDAWANKDKVEPFQFMAESLVKLNNIEYAMLELDKLEKEINVDACAEVIQKNTPPPAQRPRKQEQYVFTIKIIEAEDLKACDMNGLSDPYLVLGDEYQKRLAKTRVIYSNLNPRWDETVDIVTTGPLNIIATIWDWDAFGEHDCVGRASLKLDPSHFRDYMPREYWLDLDTQGRLLLRVSMEGERDDIQFYFGKAFRTLKRTERDMTRKITDKLSAYIHYCLSRQRLKSLLNRNALPTQALTAVTNYFARNRAPVAPPPTGPTPLEVTNALKPLFNYFNDNFAIMKETLTEPAMVMVMTRLWKEVLVTIESLLIPPLSDKPSMQRPLTQQEVDIVYKWLQLLFDFFHAVDEETQTSNGVPLDILKSPKYHDLKNLNFFYFEPTPDLIRTSEAMASASATRQQEAVARMHKHSTSSPSSLTSPTQHGFGGAIGLLGVPTKRHKSVMLNRNLGTMRKAKEEKRKMAQAEPSDDIILRILRMRPEAERYLKERSKQKEKLAAAVAAQEIVRQSLAGGSGWGRMGSQMGGYPR